MLDSNNTELSLEEQIDKLEIETKAVEDLLSSKGWAILSETLEKIRYNNMVGLKPAVNQDGLLANNALLERAFAFEFLLNHPSSLVEQNKEELKELREALNES